MSDLPPPPPFDPSDRPVPPPSGFPTPGGPVPSGVVTPVDNGLRFGAFLLEIVLTFATCGFGWLIWSIVLWQQSTTPAKKMLKLRVVDVATGAPATTGQMMMRELVGKIAIGFGANVVGAALLGNSDANLGSLIYLVSGILILTTATRQGVWDYIAKTTVVRAS